MSQDNAITATEQGAPVSSELMNLLLKEMMPELVKVISERIDHAVAVYSSPTMTKEHFAAINGLGMSTLEKWISNGVVLLAPTPTSSVKRKTTDNESGESRTEVMTRHGNPLINVAAWREKNRQHAINCRYIKR